MIYRIFITLLFLLPAVTGFTQDAPTTQHIYLKDGSFLVGQVVEQTEEKIVIRTSYGDVREIPLSAVDQIRKTSESHTYFSKGKSLQKKGLYGLATLHLLPGLEDNPWNGGRTNAVLGLGISLGMGYQFNPLFSVDASMGLDLYTERIVAVPTLGVRTYILDAPVSPYLRLQAGYGWSLFSSNFNDGPSGGPIFHPAVGVRFASRGNSEIHLDLGYRFQHLTIQGGWFTDEIQYRRMSFRFTLLF